MFFPARQMQGIGAAGRLLPRDVLLARDGVTVRALQAAGLAALVTLPLLLLASVAVGVPLAGPSLIASGYLCIAFSLASKRSRQAAILTLIVFAGLVAWSLLCFVAYAAPGPWAVSAALLAPLFAAAPALARFGMTPDAAIGAKGVQRSESTERDISLSVLKAFPQPANEATWTIAEAGDTPHASVFASDIQDAVEFASKDARRTPGTRDIRVDFAAEADLLVACDRQTCRRIVRALLDCAMMRVLPGGCIAFSARKLRGAVLLRVRLQGEREAGLGNTPVDLGGGQRMADACALVEAAGGTLIQDVVHDEVWLSARLVPAPAEAACVRNEENSGAG